MKRKLLLSSTILLSISLFPSCNNNKVTITFDPLEGTIVGNNKITVNKGTTWNQISNKPTAESTNPNVYTFAYWTKKNEGSESIPVPESFKFNENTTVYAIYENKPLTPFNTDSWTNIINEANKGKSAFESKYGKINTLIGQTRKLLVDGSERTVRLVASSHDVISKKQNKTSLLTFQFSNSVTTAKFNNRLGYNSYVSSPIRTACNEVFESITDLNIKNNINTVIKKSYSGGLNPIITENEEKLYVPSYSEVNGDSTNGPLDEESFEYYANYPSSRRIKSTWTRTSSNENTNVAYLINERGNLEVKKGEGFSIAPCFSIGVDTNSPSTFKFYNASWKDIVDNSTKEVGGLKKLKEVYNLNTFVGLTHPITINNEDYLVRVIGENQDYISRNEYGALTFMLTTPYSSSSIFDDDYNGYNNSTIEKFANDLSVHFPNDIKNNLNSVISHSSKGNHSTEYETTTDVISLLSAKELGIVSNKKEILVFNEGYTYSYFNNDDVLDNKYRMSANANYYLRSSNFNITSEVLIVKKDDSVEKDDFIGSYSINPTINIPSLVFKFSIGVSEITDTLVNFYSNSIISSNPIKRTQNDEYYKTTLSINAEPESEIFNHCRYPDEFKIVVNTNTNDSVILSSYGTLTETNVGYHFDDKDQILTLSTPNQIINKYFSGNPEITLSSIEMVPELEIVDTDTWGEIYTNIKNGAAKQFYIPGVTKKLLIDNNYYSVRLIGINKDNNEPATFMFADPIRNTDKSLITANYFAQDNYKYKWSESSLKTTYQSYKDVLETSMTVLIPVTLETVSKTTNYFDYNTMQEVISETTTDETVFSLSYDEIFDSKKKYAYFADSTISNRIVKAQLFDGVDGSRFLLRDTNKPSDSVKTRYSYANYDSNNQQIYIDIEASSVASIIPTTNLYPCFVL